MKRLQEIIQALLRAWRDAPGCGGSCNQGRGACDCRGGKC